MKQAEDKRTRIKNLKFCFYILYYIKEYWRVSKCYIDIKYKVIRNITNIKNYNTQ